MPENLKYYRNYCAQLECKIKNLENQLSKKDEIIDQLIKNAHDTNNEITELKKTISALTTRNIRIRANNQNTNKKDQNINKKKSKKKTAGWKKLGPVDEYITVDQTTCECGNKLSGPTGYHTRFLISIIAPRKVVKEITRIRRYCSRCKKQVSAPVPDALPNSRFSIRLMLLAVSLKTIGVSYKKITELFKMLFQIIVTESSINNMILKISNQFTRIYNQLIQKLRKASNIHGDETSWRVNGVNYWLWALVSKYVTIYEIVQSRGAKVPMRILKGFNGNMTSDSWSAWNKVGLTHQRCLLHYLREINDTIQYKMPGKEFTPFAKTLKKILHDSQQCKTGDVAAVAKLKSRINRLIENYKDSTEKNCRRFLKRLRREKDMLFTFILTGTDYHNNTAERAIRQNVVMRKITYGHRTQKGADAHKILMSVKETCRMNKMNFYNFMLDYLMNSTSKL